MKPSFFTLFKRGRYYRSTTVNEDGEQSVTARQEQERFTAAAIAFCFAHDDEFCRHFWANICRIEGEPDFPESTPTIEVEPHAWADLLIRGEICGTPFALAIECKVRAELENHQNPLREEFSQANGYGQFMCSAFKDAGDTKLRYVILGFREPLKLPDFQPSLGIRISQRQWSDLERNAPMNPLVNDLFDSLGQMGVGEFSMRQFKNMKVTSGLERVCDAVGVIYATIANFNLDTYPVEAGALGDNGSCLGVYIKNKGNREFRHKLLALTQSEGSLLFWLGYENLPGKVPLRTIWLYCGSKMRADLLSLLIKSKDGTVSVTQAEGDGDEPCVVISDRPDLDQFDVDWFSSKLRLIGDLKVK